MKDYFAHPSAIVDEGATIGFGTKIWHFCHISPKAAIGQKCVFGLNAFIANNVRIGNRGKIQNDVSVYEGVIFAAGVPTRIVGWMSAYGDALEFGIDGIAKDPLGVSEGLRVRGTKDTRTPGFSVTVRQLLIRLIV